MTEPTFDLNLEVFRLGDTFEDTQGIVALYVIHPHFEDGSATAEFVASSFRPAGRAVEIGCVNFGSHEALVAHFNGE